MRTGRPRAELKLSPQEQAQLSSLAASRSLPHALVARAKLVLWAAAGASNSTIAQRLSWSLPTVGKWRQRFVEQRLAGLHDELRPGRPRSYGDEQVAGLINRVLHSKPKAATQWSVRSVAEQTGISKSTVARYFALFGLQPHRSKSFKLSTDPFFVEKVRDVVGLYLNPPDKALVLCVDEKSQVQALERTQPVLPIGLGYVEGVTHDYYRHGTTTLFAALNVLDGSVISQCKPRHRHQEFLAFLNHS
jgi:putative transposase